MNNKKALEDCNNVNKNNGSLYFGMYPQSIVEDKELISKLNAKVKFMPTYLNSRGWEFLGYNLEKTYKGTYYIDLELNGDKYRGVYFKDYGDNDWIITHQTIESWFYSRKEGKDKVYFAWFKFEPIEWEVIKVEDEKALIVSRSLLDFAYFAEGFSKEKGEDYKSNNYMNSHIRSWLNDCFYKVAFNDTEKECVEITEVDNGIESTGDKINPYVCDNTKDKMFLLSNKEVKVFYLKNSKRRAKCTSYVKEQRWYPKNKEAYKQENYWLRSPSVFENKQENGAEAIYKNKVQCVNKDGEFVNFDSNTGNIAVRPACWIKLKNN